MARGDHLYVERLGGIYSHHAIDCGDGTVIHYWPDETLLRPSVQRTTLEEFAEGGTVWVRHYDECDPPETALRRAEGSLGARGFDPVTNNCEHFAVWCKTGRLESRQIAGAASYVRERPLAAAAVVMLSPVLVPTLAFTAFVRNFLDCLEGGTGEGEWR